MVHCDRSLKTYWREVIKLSAYHGYAKSFKARQPFKTKSGAVSAKQEGNEYVVYSYATPMLRYDTKRGKVTHFETRRWGCTTSRLQNILARIFDQQVPATEDREQVNIPISKPKPKPKS